VPTHWHDNHESKSCLNLTSAGSNFSAGMVDRKSCHHHRCQSCNDIAHSDEPLFRERERGGILSEAAREGGTSSFSGLVRQRKASRMKSGRRRKARLDAGRYSTATKEQVMKVEKRQEDKDRWEEDRKREKQTVLFRA